MKPSIWDILTGVTLLGILVLIFVFGFLLLQPGAAPASTAVDSAASTMIPTVSIPTSTITNTPLPATATPLASATPTKKYSSPTPLPSSTPLKLPTFTKSPRAGGSGGSSGGSGSCLVTSQTPVDGSFVLAGDPISVSWTLKNTSSKTWRADSVDIRHTSGVGGGAEISDLEYDVSSQGEYGFKVTLGGQTASGTYSSNWGVYEGNIPLCRFFVQFRIP